MEGLWLSLNPTTADTADSGSKMDTTPADIDATGNNSKWTRAPDAVMRASPFLPSRGDLIGSRWPCSDPAIAVLAYVADNLQVCPPGPEWQPRL